MKYFMKLLSKYFQDYNYELNLILIKIFKYFNLQGKWIIIDER
jgi:hypothetical protein